MQKDLSPGAKSIYSISQMFFLMIVFRSMALNVKRHNLFGMGFLVLVRHRIIILEVSSTVRVYKAGKDQSVVNPGVSESTRMGRGLLFSWGKGKRPERLECSFHFGFLNILFYSHSLHLAIHTDGVPCFSRFQKR